MLSEAERQFLEEKIKGKVSISPEYARTLKSRIRKKYKIAKQEMKLIEKSGVLE